jgi:hypothetical protein
MKITCENITCEGNRHDLVETRRENELIIACCEYCGAYYEIRFQQIARGDNLR